MKQLIRRLWDKYHDGKIDSTEKEAHSLSIYLTQNYTGKQVTEILHLLIQEVETIKTQALIDKKQEVIELEQDLSDLHQLTTK